MRILISNDDGIYSPGLHALAAVAAKFGEVRIVAPDVEQSSMSHAITATRPLNYRPTPIKGFEAYRVNGTPADCVALGVFNWEKVDLVLSGINLGTNLGNAIWHSGTLAAAKQAVLLGLRGIAFSTPSTEVEPKFDVISAWVEKALKFLLPLRDLELVNVNVPEKPRGLIWTQQSFRHYDGKVVPGQDPMGRKHFWFTVRPIEQVEEGSDRWAMENNFVSMTPLRVELTENEKLRGLREKGIPPELAGQAPSLVK
ncbi:MAG TPA: 5'/3'-nucleotidase SurE [Opitutaceae bacterium]|nr:5'/3'-nucleotidase SurE [Opitutaceae bacterium]